MCGLTGLYLRSVVPNIDVLEVLLKYGELRGVDGAGYCIIEKDDFRGWSFFSTKNKDLEALYRSFKGKSLKPNSVFLANHRAAPETEIGVEGDINKCLQPIVYEKEGICLIHNGAVSNRIYKELSGQFEAKTEIDSEAIIWSYLKHNRDIKSTMEFLTGGFSVIMIDTNLEKLYAICTHNPLYVGHVRGNGLFFSSFEDAIYKTISKIKGYNITRMNIAIWEDYYVWQIPENTIIEYDLQSDMVNEIKFTPRYIHPNYDPLTVQTKYQVLAKKVLVSASGGLDSSTTLATLKMAGYDVTAVHFNYGHRGGDAERIAIKNVCRIMNIPVIEFDLEANMRLLDKTSMLVNPDHPITTGTSGDLKTTIAWTCFRNGFFVSYMAALAESLIINEKFSEVYFTGGFMNLTESGVYPDNSERFIQSFSKFVKFASIVGTRIKPLYGCANLLKTEQYFLLQKFRLLEELSPWLISCDRPKVIKGLPHNCSKNGKPACGSGLLSYWACKKAGVQDLRLYYEVEDEDYVAYEPPGSLKPIIINMENVLSKLQFHEENKNLLRTLLM